MGHSYVNPDAAPNDNAPAGVTATGGPGGTLPVDTPSYQVCEIYVIRIKV